MAMNGYAHLRARSSAPLLLGSGKTRPSWTATELAGERLERLMTRVQTPAFVYDERTLVEKLGKVAATRAATGVRVLYSLKPFAMVDALRLLAQGVDGFSASSLFEARLARQILGPHRSVHLTTPGFQPREIDAINELCDHVTFNSLSQWARFRDRLTGAGKGGLRINPLLPLVDDDRYNPCRAQSKLGVPIDQVARLFDSQPHEFNGLGGLHFHTHWR